MLPNQSRRFAFPRPWFMFFGLLVAGVIWNARTSFDVYWPRAAVAAVAGLVLAVFLNFARGGTWIDLVRTRR